MRYLILLILSLPATVLADYWFDAHVHFNADHAKEFSPAQVIKILDDSHVSKAAVTSSPPGLAIDLYDYAPDRIVPVLGVYTDPDDKTSWLRDRRLPVRLVKLLDDQDWAGIGELHLFARDRHSSVFRQVIKHANSRRLPVLVHTDPAVIDKIYELVPSLPVIWAHAGKYPYPDLLTDYLDRYPALYIDLSMRDERIAPDGQLSDDWYDLIVSNPDRFVIGVDTHSTPRWQDYQAATTKIRDWLSKLPQDVADKLRYENAYRIYKLHH